MDKNKLSYYASYVAIACGIFLLVMKLYGNDKSSTTTVMALLFVVIGVLGLRKYRNN